MTAGDDQLLLIDLVMAEEGVSPAVRGRVLRALLYSSPGQAAERLGLLPTEGIEGSLRLSGG